MDEGIHEGLDEELPQPRRHRDLPFRRRLGLDIGLGALGLILAVFIGSALARNGGSSGAAQSAPASPSISRAAAPAPLAPAATDFVTVTAVPGGWLPRPAHRLKCPYETRSISLIGLAAPAREAVRAAFAGATITFGRTVRLYVKNLGGALIALDIAARRDGERITLRLRSIVLRHVGQGGGAQTATVILNGRRILQYQTRLGRYSVVVQVEAPASRKLRLAPLVHLATDLRLLSAT